ncbi:unnamed protein product [Calypogeia fissa]
MAGTRFPSNGVGPDSGITAASNRSVPSYYATSAQSLYSDLWQDMRTYIDAYCSVTRNQQPQQQQHSVGTGAAGGGARTSSSSMTDFSSSPASNQSSLSYQQPYSTFPKDLDGAVNFADLANLEPNPGGNNNGGHSINGDNSHSAVAPTIQFDLGSNLLTGSSQQQQQGDSSTNFSAPYNTYASQAAMTTNTTQGDASEACFNNDPSMSSAMWNMVNNSNIGSNMGNNMGNNMGSNMGSNIGNNMGNSMGNSVSDFGSPSSSGQTNLSSMTSMANNGATVDFTARWGMRSSGQPSPNNQSNMSNNGRPEQQFVGRLRPYVREPSVALIRRIGSALEQRLYVIDRKLVGDPQAPTACDYQVLGAAGNVDTVRLATIPSCTCLDTQHPCKHILFIMLRVLKLSSEDHRIWQDALYASEVSDLIRKPILDSDGLQFGGQKGRNRFQDISNHVTESMGAGGDGNGRLKNLQREVGGDCPVCFEEMGNADGSAKEEVSFCKVCGNNVHKDCFQRWSLSKQEAGERLTCIFCRSPWFDDSLQLKKRKAASESPADGYVNIADYSTGHHQAEDMSLESLYPSLRPKFEPEWRGC